MPLRRHHQGQPKRQKLTFSREAVAATDILWRDVGIRLWLCEGPMLWRGEPPRCYVECLDEPQRPFIPFQISTQPGVLDDDLLCTVFPYTPLPPAVSDRIEAFIRTNVTVLLRHWRGETDSLTLLDRLQPPGGSAEAAERRRGREG